MDVSKFLSVALAFLVILNIVTIVVVVYRFYNWTKTNPNELYRVLCSGLKL